MFIEFSFPPALPGGVSSISDFEALLKHLPAIARFTSVTLSVGFVFIGLHAKPGATRDEVMTSCSLLLAGSVRNVEEFGAKHRGRARPSVRACVYTRIALMGSLLILIFVQNLYIFTFCR